MAAVPGTHVHTADNAVHALGDDLDGLLADIRGFLPRPRPHRRRRTTSALERLTVQQTQTVVTMLAGSTDPVEPADRRPRPWSPPSSHGS
ncbi:hypothetical protein ACFQ51_52155 [Streptomyces kaempferi]